MQLVTIFVLLTISVCVCHGWLYRSFFRGLKRVSDAQPVPTRKGNIALRKRAQQDSTISYGIATLAVDGNRNGLYTVGNSCTHTRLKGPHFWTVDLTRSYSVGDIRITNRRDCCSDRLKNLEIYLRNDKAVKESRGNRRYRCAVYNGPPKKGQKSITISCGGRRGRYLSILKKTGYLSLCEVEVFKAPPPPPIPTSKGNIARGKRAQQDSTESGGVAGRAVDGNRNGFYAAGKSCTHTRRKGPHFWTVDLKHSYSVGDIRITNRRDCCSDRLKNLEIYLRSDKAVKESGGNRRYRCAVYGGPPKKGQHSITISCGGRRGRYLSILKNSGYLSLCEVEVFKTKPNRRRPKFVMIQGRRNFDESKRKCEELGMKIAVIRNQLEQQAAAKATRVKDHSGCVHRGNLGGCRAFIGYKRVYRWIGGTSSYRYFHKKEPNNNENCVEVNYYGQAKAKWSDVSCKKKLSVLCMRP